MTASGNVLELFYDAAGRPTSFKYNGVQYYYVTNQQGDVVAILNRDGDVQVEYTYDAWGKVLSVTGPKRNTLGKLNPIRYRGYFFDSETGLYYLQSRYYNPEIGRFINADAFNATGQGLIGNNMFTYCNNNPVLLVDYCGNFGIVASMAIGLLGGVVSQYVCDVVDNIMEGKTGADILCARGTLGEYITAGLAGAVCAVPGANALVSVACDVAAPALEQSIDILIYNRDWDWQKYKEDVVSNVICDLGSSVISFDSPKYIRDIKEEAQKHGKKGTKQLNSYLSKKQNAIFVANQAVNVAVTATYHTTYSIISSSNQRPATYRGLVV